MINKIDSKRRERKVEKLKMHCFPRKSMIKIVFFFLNSYSVDKFNSYLCERDVQSLL